MKSFFSNIITVLLFTIALVGCGTKSGDRYTLKGTINEKYPITMNITIADDDTVTGKYYYDEHKIDIVLTGNSTKTGLILEEIVDGKMTGEFIGSFDKDSIVYRGNWVNTSTKKSMPFEVSVLGSKKKVIAKNSVSNKNESYLKRFEGTYGEDEGETYHHITLTYINPTKMLASVYGITYSGFSGTGDYILEYIDGQLVFEATTKIATMDGDESGTHNFTVYIVDDDTIGIDESGSYGLYGANFGDFSGTHDKINDKTLRSDNKNTTLTKFNGVYKTMGNNEKRVLITASYIGSNIMYFELKMFDSYFEKSFVANYDPDYEVFVYTDYYSYSLEFSGEIQITVLDENRINVVTPDVYSIDGEMYNSSEYNINGIYKKK